jgi:hypothetical protein
MTPRGPGMDREPRLNRRELLARSARGNGGADRPSQTCSARYPTPGHADETAGRRLAVRTILCLCTVSVIAFFAWTSVALAHWPGQPPHQMAQLGDLTLETGEVIKNFRMSYVTHGTLNAAKDNAILFHHGLGGS